jgi:hypothetical protein
VARASNPHTRRIGARNWRVSDPSIPEPLRAALVRELMEARRAVARALGKASIHSGKAPGSSVDAAALKLARARVQDAKVALGERGPRYWEALDDAAWRERARAALTALARSRAPDKSLCPSEAARVIGGAAWRSRMPLVREVARELARAGRLELRQKGRVVDPDRTIRGPVRVARRGGEEAVTRPCTRAGT